MRFPRRNSVVAVVVIASVAVATSQTPALADPLSTSELEQSVDAAIDATGKDVAATYPQLQFPTPAAPATLSVTSNDGNPATSEATMEVDVPVVGGGTTLSDGLSKVWTASGGTSSVVVQPVGETARALLVIESGSAPQEWDFDFGGDVASLEIDPEGTGEVLGYNANGDLTTIIDPAWAVDDMGEPVPTYYEVNGTTLTQVIVHGGRMAYPVVADPDWYYVGKCTLAIGAFAVENAAYIAKFWKVFTSVKKFIKLMKEIRKMPKASKITYLKSKLGSIASEFTGWGDLVSRCTP